MQITRLMTSLFIMSIFKIADFVAYDNKKKNVLYVCKLRLITWCLDVCVEYILVTLRISDDF